MEGRLYFDLCTYKNRIHCSGKQCHQAVGMAAREGS